MWSAATLAHEEADDEVEVADEDEGRRQDGFTLVLDHQAVALELPHLSGHSVHLMKRVAEENIISKEIRLNY